MTRKAQTKEAPELFHGTVIENQPPSAPEIAKRRSQQVAVPAKEAVPAPANLLAALARAAADPRCEPGKMRELYAIQKEIEADKARLAFTAAYVAMQADLPTINANGKIEIEAREKAGRTTRAQSTPFATYQEIHRVTKPILRQHGFSLFFTPEIGNDDRISIRGHLAHVGGHSVEGSLRAPLETSGSKNNLQGAGSTLSYLKRYLAISLLNIISEAPEDKDDDGNAAGNLRGEISAQQCDTIIELGKAAGCGWPALRSWLNKRKPKGHPDIEHIEQIPASRFAEATNGIKLFEDAARDRETARQNAGAR